MDLYRYDDKWEKEPANALDSFFTLDDAMASALVPITSKVKPQPQTCIIDLRQPLDFHDFHLPGSVNVPLVHEDTPSPFSEPSGPYILESLWKRLEEAFKAPSKELRDLLCGRRILLLCYDGDSARVATSVLRAKGHEADSIKGGFKALRRLREKSDSSFRASNETGVEVSALHLRSHMAAAQVV